MLFCKPFGNNEAISELFPDEPLDSQNVYGAYELFDREKPAGKALVLVCGTRCAIARLSFSGGDLQGLELLVRACLHFAANRGAYTACCALPEFRKTLLSLGFRETDGVFSGDIPTLLQGSCGQCGAPNG